MARLCRMAVAVDAPRSGGALHRWTRSPPLLAEAFFGGAAFGRRRVGDFNHAGAGRLAAQSRARRRYRQAGPRWFRAYQRGAAAFGDGRGGAGRFAAALLDWFAGAQLHAAHGGGQEALCPAAIAAPRRASGRRRRRYRCALDDDDAPAKPSLVARARALLPSWPRKSAAAATMALSRASAASRRWAASWMTTKTRLRISSSRPCAARSRSICRANRKSASSSGKPRSISAMRASICCRRSTC